MDFKFEHKTNDYATHQPVLWEIVKNTTGPVVEFGCGFGSTPLLHYLCEASGRELLTLESNKEWISKFEKEYSTTNHRFQYVSSWDKALEDHKIIDKKWDVVFVDQSPWEARHKTILKLKDTCKFIILHDCDYFPTHKIFGTSIKPLLGMHDEGERKYDDLFKYYKEFFPLHPWPYLPTGPPTLLASNFESCDFNIDYSKY